MVTGAYLLARIVVGRPDECWEWQGARNAQGYGVAWDSQEQRTRLAHRAAYTTWVGPIAPGICLLHSCDNPMCCNPEHLHEGTRSQNQREMVERGRSCRGEKAPHARLTAAEVLAVRRARSQGATAASLADRYGVSQWAVYDACNGRTWSHLAAVRLLR